MTSYTVQPGDSPASVAGKLYGDQRRYVDLIGANGGNWHPGDVIDIPDITGTASPVITNQQWAGTQTGFKNGQAQYGNSGAATNAGPAPATFSKPKTPNFGSAGQYDSRNGANAGTSPWAAQTPAFANPAATNATPTTPNAAGTYDRRSNRNQGVNSAGGAMPTTQTAGYNANPALWGQLPAAVGSKHSGGPMGGGAGPAGGQQTQGGPGGIYNTFNQPNNQSDALDRMFPGAQPGKPQGAQSATQQAVNNGVDIGAGYQALSNAMKPTGYAAYEQGYNTASTIPPEMANIAWSARNVGQAFAAYGGKYGPAWKNNRAALPLIVDPRVANEIPLELSGFKDTPSLMAALGYAVDASGNYIRKDPMVSQGYGSGGNNYGTATAVPSGYSYGGWGGYGYGGGGGAQGSHTPASGPAGGGLVTWRITA